MSSASQPGSPERTGPWQIGVGCEILDVSVIREMERGGRSPRDASPDGHQWTPACSTAPFACDDPGAASAAYSFVHGIRTSETEELTHDGAGADLQASLSGIFMTPLSPTEVGPAPTPSRHDNFAAPPAASFSASSRQGVPPGTAMPWPRARSTEEQDERRARAALPEDGMAAPQDVARSLGRSREAEHLAGSPTGEVGHHTSSSSGDESASPSVTGGRRDGVTLPRGTEGSVGSVGHPEMCARPCMFFESGSCANGAACDFCHMEHATRPAKLDRWQRDALRAMSPERAKALILPVLWQRALEFDSSAATQQALSHLAAACSFEPSTGEPLPRGETRQERALTKQLGNISLRVLMFTALRSVLCSEPDAQAEAEALLSHLRSAAEAREVAGHVQP